MSTFEIWVVVLLGSGIASVLVLGVGIWHLLNEIDSSLMMLVKVMVNDSIRQVVGDIKDLDALIERLDEAAAEATAQREAA